MPSPTEVPALFHRLGGREGILQFLRYFYADVRQQRDIGPIFAAKIHDWPSHLEKIADFWSGLTGGPARYPGGFAYKHLSLGLEEVHFQAWLGLWERHCRAHLKSPEAEEMIALAHGIGQRLRQITGVGRPQ